MNKILIALLIAVAAAAGWFGFLRHDHDHDHDHPHGAAARAESPRGLSITHYTETTELFVEFPALVANRDAPFAAHMTFTRSDGFKAVADGRLIVALAGGGLPEERAEARISGTPGIFRPVLRPQHAGKRELTFELTTEEGKVVHEAGEVVVYPDSEAARIGLGPEAESGGIKLTKEQQWQIEFVSEPAARLVVRESVQTIALVRPRASGEALMTAPAAVLLLAGTEGFPQIGMRVQAGQVIAYLVPRLGGETDIATLHLSAERARIELDQARQDRIRLEGLLRQEAVPERRVREAISRERIAQAEVNAAQQRLSTHQGGTGGIALRAPISGTLVSVSVSPGAPVIDGQLLLHIADLDRIWLEARIAEGDLGRVTAPAGAFFKPDGQDSAIVLEVGRNASLVAFGGMVDRETRTVPAIFEFGNPDGRLRAGLSLRAALYTGRTLTGISVPATAIVDDNGQPVVFVQVEGESFERRVVTLGFRDGDMVAVRSGLAEGERVVSRGAYSVRLAATAPAAFGEGHSH